MTLRRSHRRHLLWPTVLLFALSGCGGERPSADEAAPVATTMLTAAQVEPFCAAVRALDATDGTTAQEEVLQALADMVRTAPGQVREDVRVLADNLIIDNYPSAVTAAMKRSSVAVGAAAGQRVGAFVEQHCGVSAGQ